MRSRTKSIAGSEPEYTSPERRSKNGGQPSSRALQRITSGIPKRVATDRQGREAVAAARTTSPARTHCPPPRPLAFAICSRPAPASTTPDTAQRRAAGAARATACAPTAATTAQQKFVAQAKRPAARKALPNGSFAYRSNSGVPGPRLRAK